MWRVYGGSSWCGCWCLEDSWRAWSLSWTQVTESRNVTERHGRWWRWPSAAPVVGGILHAERDARDARHSCAGVGPQRFQRPRRSKTFQDVHEKSPSPCPFILWNFILFELFDILIFVWLFDSFPIWKAFALSEFAAICGRNRLSSAGLQHNYHNSLNSEIPTYW